MLSGVVKAQIVSALDLTLGWLLRLPTELVVVFSAASLAMAVLLVRWLATNQSLLRRCVADKSRLREIMREAALNSKKSDLGRARQTNARVVLRQLKLEVPYLAISVVPILLIFAWCSLRIEFLPPTGAEPIDFVAYFSSSAVGEPVHLVPIEGLRVENGWIQEIRPNGPDGYAHWILRAAPRPEIYPLRIQYQGNAHDHPLLIGQPTYAPPVIADRSSLYKSEIRLRPATFFGVSLNRSFFSLLLWGWILSILPLTFTFVGKRVCRLA